MTASEDSLRKTFADGVYVHAVGGPLTHNAGCLIEGLMTCDIPVKVSTAQVTSRPAAMPLKGVDLKPRVSPAYTHFAGYIVDISHTNVFVPFEGIPANRVVYLNQSDVAAFARVPDGHLLFAAHDTRFAVKGGVRHPIAFGLSNGLIAATQNQAVFKTRKRAALRNFRATLSQSLRALLDISYVPALERGMPVDRSDYAPDAYIEAMLGNAVCLAYGGDFYAPIMTNPWFRKNDPALADIHAFERLDAPAAVMRWDSFRLWESFAAGCLTVHLDFDKYGFALPVMPTAWEHYAPIDLDDIAGSVDQLMNREKDWPAIAAAGRAWAIQHYAPKPTALRVLAALQARNP